MCTESCHSNFHHSPLISHNLYIFYPRHLKKLYLYHSRGESSVIYLYTVNICAGTYTTGVVQQLINPGFVDNSAPPCYLLQLIINCSSSALFLCLMLNYFRVDSLRSMSGGGGCEFLPPIRKIWRMLLLAVSCCILSA